MPTATENYRYSRLRVARFDREIPAVAIGRAVYFPLRTLCEQMGLAPQKQIGRLRADSRFRGALRDLPIPTIKGRRDTVCIRKQDVGGWLATVDPAHCALARTRKQIEEFQAELFAAADRWLFGDNSDVVYDPATKSDKPISGKLHLGDCPRCGLPLCLVMDSDGNHLVPDVEEE